MSSYPLPKKKDYSRVHEISYRLEKLEHFNLHSEILIKMDKNE